MAPSERYVPVATTPRGRKPASTRTTGVPRRERSAPATSVQFTRWYVTTARSTVQSTGSGRSDRTREAAAVHSPICVRLNPARSGVVRRWTSSCDTDPTATRTAATAGGKSTAMAMFTGALMLR
jgi:hypothetical protein